LVVDIEILKSKREDPIVCHDGFLYTQHPITVEKRGCVGGGGCLRILISTLTPTPTHPHSS